MAIHSPTTVRVTSPEGGHAIGTRVHDTKTGEEIRGIARIAIPEFGADDLIKVELTLAFAVLLVEGTPVFHMVHPQTGERKQIAGIRFVDGTEFEAQ